MSALIKPYEISLWEDVLDNNGNFVEQRVCIIGADTMVSQSRALDPTLVTNVNGSNTLTFSIYYTYIDNLTGQRVDNPFGQYITNERKIKLHYNNKWYDLIIKNIKYDSSKKNYIVTAIDQYINELSKNGFNKTFDAELNNNVGSVQTLAQRTLEATDWDVPSINPLEATPTTEFIPDIAKESLVKLHVLVDVPAMQIQDSEIGKCPTEEEDTIPRNATIYAFYSCCADKTKRFQFYYFADEQEIEIDDERIITNYNHQYYIDNVNYSTDATSYGITIPEWATLDTLEPISTHYRGARYVYSPDTHFSVVLKNYVTAYTKNNVTYYGYSKDDYIAPNLINDWVSNSSEFKSTAGWTTARITDSGVTGEVQNQAIRWAGSTSYLLLDDLRNGRYSDSYEYEAFLRYTGPSTGALVNSGFYDNRINIDNLVNGTQYVVRMKFTGGSGGTLRLGQYSYNTETKTYTIDESHTFFKINLSSLVREAPTSLYYYGVVTIENADFTPAQYKKQLNGKVNLILSGMTGIDIYSLQVFELLPGTRGVYEGQIYYDGFTLPEDQVAKAKIITTYYLYPNNIDDDSTKTREDFKPTYEGLQDPITLGYTLGISCEKRRSISVKESNFFNIIQTICENFECYAVFDIQHNAAGAITKKRVLFKNFIGKDNYAGFRYGVNLKSITRTDDSKQIVTKLIVKQNANEFGPHGFCTITRAGSNETGENYILNFDYYINHGLLDFANWTHSIYDLTGAEGKDIDPTDETTNSNGYYVRLRTLNDELELRNADLQARAVVLSEAKNNLSIYENGLASAVDEFEKADEDLYAITGGYHYNQITPQVTIPKRDEKYLVKCSETLQAKKDYERKALSQRSYVNELEATYVEYEEQIDRLIEYKEALNKAFYSKYYRFIQEGTWNSEDYYDDEKYYLDALSTNYDASMPKSSYNISVLELSRLPGYEGFTFALGDKTFMEDPEFFGYDDSGAPIRERVLLTEISYSLDQPDKNTIKISNYKTSFQDLFKKITATVQSVQYSAGTYDRAGQIAMANDTIKSEFIQGALNDAGTILQNLAQQSVRIDDEGLTIADSLEPNKLLRAVAGGILLSQDGGLTWDVGITANGINAKTITTGILNTGAVNIMYSDEPTFRWDAFGLTAYAWAQNSPLTPIFSEGVRFDRMGIYGFNIGSGDGAEWHPNNVAEWEIKNNSIVLKDDDATHHYIRHHSVFELTEQGLYLNLGAGHVDYKYYYAQGSSGLVAGMFSQAKQHINSVHLGKIEDVLYNKWTNTGVPYYDSSDTTSQEFIKVFSVGPTQNNEKFALYDDGSLKANDVYIHSIRYNNGAGMTTTVFSSTRIAEPVDGTDPTSFPSTGAGWHLDQGANDVYQSTTFNNGATWTTTSIITGKLEVSRTTNYGVDTTSTKTATSTLDLVPWTSNISSIDLSQYKGKYFYTRQRITYDDNSTSAWFLNGLELLAEDGGKGDPGDKTAIVYLYKRSATDVTVTWTNDLEYSFVTHSITSTLPTGWSQSIPADDGNPCYVTAATAYSATNTDSIAYNEWSTPIKMVKDGDIGPRGPQTAIVYLYKRQASGTPTIDWTNNLTYTFSTKTLNPVPSGWSTTVPTGTDKCYVTAATAYSAEDSATLAKTAWSTPVQYSGIDGQPGANGYATVVLTAYVRSATAPTEVDWTSDIQYEFATNTWTIPSGSAWSKTIPAVDSSNPLPCYSSVATASSNTGSDTIAWGEWSTPIKLVENGEDGEDGADGLATATLMIYKRSASVPQGISYSGNITYQFASPNSWDLPSGTGWSKTIPSGTDPCYISRAVALSNTGSDTIPSSEWTAPELLVANGAQGDPGPTGTHGTDVVIHDIYISCTNTTTPPTTPSTEVTNNTTTANQWTLNNAPSTGSTYKYIWHCKQAKTTVYNSNGSTTVTVTCDAPELWKAYNGSTTTEEYAEFLKLTNFGTSKGLFYSKKANNDNLYINASYINTGALTVSNNNTTVFEANVSNGTVYLQSTDYTPPTGTNVFSGAGTRIDVQTGTITSQSFAIKSDGSAWFDGTIHTTEITGSTSAGGLTINFTDGTITATHFNIDSQGNATYDGAITASQISGSTGADGLVINFDNNTISSHGFNIDSQGNASYTGTVSAGQLTTGDFTVKRGTGANQKTLVKFEMSTSGDEAYLQSSDYDGPDSGEVYADEGMRIDLEAGTIIAENFVIDSGGNAYFKGELQAASGTFEGTVTAGAVQSSNYADPTSGSKYSTGTKIELQNGYITTPWFYTDESGAGFKGNLTATQTEFNKLHVNGIGNYTTTNGVIEVIDDKFIIRSYSGVAENFYSQLKLGYTDTVLGGYNSSDQLLAGIAFSANNTTVTITGTTSVGTLNATSLASNNSVMKNSVIQMNSSWYGTSDPSGTPGTGVGTIYFKIID